MKKYIYRLGFLLFVYLLIISLSNKILPYAGNDTFAAKIRAFDKINEQSEKPINTIFIGSSIFNRSIDPFIFDKYTSSRTNSYNLCTDGTSTIEISYLLDKFLSTRHVDKVFIGVWPILPLNDASASTVKNTYYHDVKRFSSILKGNLYAKDIWLHTKAYIKRTLGVFLPKEGSKLLNKKQSFPENYYNNRGFYAADEEFGDSKWTNEKIEDLYNTLYEVRLKSNMHLPSKLALNPKDEDLLKWYSNIYKELSNKNIEAYFIYLPHTQHIDRKLNFINSIIIEPYEDFFKPEFYFDANHLNRKGADIFSRQLAFAFIKQT